MVRTEDKQTDEDWEHFAATDPFWAVITWDEFRQENLDAESLEKFFATGEEYVHWATSVVQRQLGGISSSDRALDFGCGVGRLTLPIARRFGSVVGVDVSESMLARARSVAADMGMDNVTYVKGDDELSAVTGKFDLVHSHIVLQHIPVSRGQRLFRRLVECVDEGGMGILHVTYAKAEMDGVGGEPGASGDEPVMQMNDYPLNPLFHMLQSAGARRIHVELTDHVGHFGMLLFFRKLPGDHYHA